MNLQVASFDLGRDITNDVYTSIENIVTKFSPDIMCLQRFDSSNPIVCDKVTDFLRRSGFAIDTVEKVAIAYKAALFLEVPDSCSTTFNRKANKIINECEDCIVPPSPALYVDLVHTATGKIVRVVTQKLLEYDSTSYKRREKSPVRKIDTTMLKNSASTARLNWLIAQNEQSAAAIGDAALELSLDDIECPDDKHELTIFAISAHATAKYVSSKKKRRLHPLRLRLFEIRGYKLDKKSKRPTAKDGTDKRKYDYILAKADKNKYHLMIQDSKIEGINNRELLENRSGNLTESHLPVLSAITLMSAPEE